MALTPNGITHSLYFKTSSVAIRGRRVVTPMDMRRPSDITAHCMISKVVRGIFWVIYQVGELF
jgi:hypothetical protein